MLSGDGDDHSSLSSGELWEYDPPNDPGHNYLLTLAMQYGHPDVL